MTNIICIGAANIDKKLQSHASIISGTSNPVSSITSYGGVARNVAENLIYLTDNVFLQCIVGNDPEGIALLTHCKKVGINVDDSITLPNYSTANYYAILNQEGGLFTAFADMEIYEHIPLDKIQKTWDKWPDNTLIFADTNFSDVTLLTLIAYCRARNLILCIDPVSVSKSKKLPLDLSGVFLLKPNLDEASSLTNIDITCIEDCYHAGQKLIERGVKNAIISLGKDGFVLVNAGQEQYVVAPVISNIKDVNGAGDAFFAGVLLGLKEGKDLIHAGEIGMMLAARTLQTYQTVAQCSY